MIFIRFEFAFGFLQQLVAKCTAYSKHIAGNWTKYLPFSR